MRSALLAVSAFLLTLPALAHADTFQYTITPSTGANPLTFTIDTSSLRNEDKYDQYATSSGTFLNLYNDDNGGGLRLFIPYFDLYGTQLFTGTTAEPSLLTGNFTLNDVDHEGAPTAITVADLSSAVTPEPSSLALLGTGLLSMAGITKRRFA